jgi:methionyl-tRNA synthetase
VPGDPDQGGYVWYDALANYITAPGYGTDDVQFEGWWNASERVHVIGKGIIRFHAVYWPAMLLSAGLTLPDTIFVHEYLTANGQKMSKSAGNAPDPAQIVDSYGSDALRWWMLSEVAGTGDTDFTAARLVARANEDLANNLGNLVNRTVAMVHRYRDGRAPADTEPGPETQALRAARAAAGPTIAAALAEFDFRRATDAVVAIGHAGNHYVEALRPWDLSRAERVDGAPTDRLDGVLAELLAAGRDVAHQLTPFLPSAAERIAVQCGQPGTRLPDPAPVFPRLEAP